MILQQGTRDPDYRLQDTTVQTVTRAGHGVCLKVCVWSCVEIVSGTSKENCSWRLVHITRGKVRSFRVPSLGTLAKIVYFLHTEIHTHSFVFLMHRHSWIKIVRAHFLWNSLYLSRGWHFVPLSFVSAVYTVLNDYSICVRWIWDRKKSMKGVALKLVRTVLLTTRADGIIVAVLKITQIINLKYATPEWFRKKVRCLCRENGLWYLSWDTMGC